MTDLSPRSPARILHFDFSTGASGDKILGALLEACEAVGAATIDQLRQIAESLLPSVAVARRKVTRGGIAASHMTVSEGNAPSRHWAEIRQMIENAATSGVLSENACELALKAFGAIAQAEAEVHGQPIDQVHFHEVGAADSIVDVVGSCYLLDCLGAASVYASPLVLGFGTVRTAHGELPVPAPATARLVIGLPVESGAHAGEMTTPTGAALAATFVTHWQPLPAMRPLAVGYGAGSRTIEGASNTVRLLVGEAASATSTAAAAADAAPAPYHIEQATLIECNIDHRTPEAMAFAAEELLAAGALDVWQEPITMKKGRLATRLSLLCQPSQGSRFADLTLKLTGSLGLRMRPVQRAVLPRTHLTLDTPYGPVRFKQGHYIDVDKNPADDTPAPATEAAQHAAHWLRPEHDEVARLARELNLDYQELHDELTALAQAAL